MSTDNAVIDCGPQSGTERNGRRAEPEKTREGAVYEGAW